MPDDDQLTKERKELREQGVREKMFRYAGQESTFKRQKKLTDKAVSQKENTSIKQRVLPEDRAFSAFVRSHLWENRQSLNPQWPYRGASACEFFTTVYASWLEKHFVSRRDLAKLDPKLVAQIDQEMNKGASRPNGLVSEYSAQILDIEDNFEREVVRQVRKKASSAKRMQRPKREKSHQHGFRA